MTRKILLREIAYGRSGDKGSAANIGIIAHTAEGYEFLKGALTADIVQRFFLPLGVTRTIRYELPNIWAFNFMLVISWRIFLISDVSSCVCGNLAITSIRRNCATSTK